MRLVFGHLADHVVEDASVVEISQLHVGVESHPHLESFPCVELRGQTETTSSVRLPQQWEDTPVLQECKRTFTSTIILGVSCSGMVTV